MVDNAIYIMIIMNAYILMDRYDDVWVRSRRMMIIGQKSIQLHRCVIATPLLLYTMGFLIITTYTTIIIASVVIHPL